MHSHLLSRIFNGKFNQLYNQVGKAEIGMVMGRDSQIGITDLYDW